MLKQQITTNGAFLFMAVVTFILLLIIIGTFAVGYAGATLSKILGWKAFNTKDGAKFIIFPSNNDKFDNAFTIGKYIFIEERKWYQSTILRHEYGHYLQYKKYGVLYPIIVAVPSLFGQIAIDIGISTNLSVEDEADRLGGVTNIIIGGNDAESVWNAINEEKSYGF